MTKGMGKFILGMVVVNCLLVTPLSANKLVVERGSDLQAVIDHAASGDTLLLGAKAFIAKPTQFTDPLCGNCEEAQTEIQASYGFIIKNKALTIIGMDRTKTRLITNAGYGLYIENASGTIISNLTITGGKRDNDDGWATDAGIVVRRSSVDIIDVDIRDNDDRDTTVVGICGVVGREGSEIRISNCNIINNGWDGVALYRGASAVVTDCLIKDGRGAGIGVTWDATCLAYRNEVTGFWKGIGSFGSSTLIARNNLVHENLGWGIVGTGSSHLEAINNVIFHNGNCGIAPWSTEARGRLINNIIAENGWRKEWVCPCVGIVNYGDWAKWEFKNNIVWNNAEGEYEGIWDQSDINGNLNVDPMFIGEGDFRLKTGSPGRFSGDERLYNIDGTRSHIGLEGGAQGRE